ncbi:MAG: CHAD domain-containing protein [Methylobacteriaceae bacterium]|nr:CHAD domain-containing protein [Methylobacteriaceae bacterium]
MRTAYFDTQAGDLWRRRIVLRVNRARRRNVMGLKWPLRQPQGSASAGELEIPVPGDEPDIALFDDATSTELHRITEGRKLERQFETQFMRRSRTLEFSHSLIEVALDEGFVATGDRRLPLAEVELACRTGDGSALFDFAMRLADSLPLRLRTMSRVERGFMLVAGIEPAPMRAAGFQWRADATLDDAVSTVITGTLAHFVANLPAFERSRDPEAIHQMRVALRRLRTALAQFDRLLPCPEFQIFRAEAKRIASALGPARNWDSFRQLVETGPLTDHRLDASFEALLGAVEIRRSEAYADARHFIEASETMRFVIGLQAFVMHRGWRSGLSAPQLPRLTENARLFAAETLDRLRKRALKRGKSLLLLPAQERHELRIALKNMRYTAEFFGDLFGGGQATRVYVRALARLQDALGAYNDTVTATSLLGSIEEAAGPKGAKASGFVLGWYGRDAALADGSLLQAWKTFRQAPAFWR